LYGSIKVKTATSGDAINWTAWSEWKTENLGSVISSANQRYIKFFVELTTSDYRYTPVLHSVHIEYPVFYPNKPAIQSDTHLPESWINLTTANFAWSGADTNGVTIGAYYFAVDSQVDTATAMHTTDNTVQLGGITDGIHFFRVVAQADWKNNSVCSETAEYEFKVDTVSPSVPSLVESSHRQFVAENNNDFFIKLSSGDALSGVKGYTYSLSQNGEEPDANCDTDGGEISIGGISNGEWIFKAKAVDFAGNTGPAFEYHIIVDYSGKLLDEKQVKIYPTISSNIIQIKYNLNAAAERIILQIKDVTGKTIKTIDGDGGAGTTELSQNISNLANGVYFVRIEALKKDGRNEVVIKKFIVVK
jgi:hypothetical protein